MASTVDRAVSGKLRDLYSSIEKRFDAIKPTANSNNNAAMMAGLFGGAGIPGLLGNINPYLPPGYLGAVPPVPGFASIGLLTSQPRTLGDAVKLLGRSGARSRIKHASSGRFT